MVDNSATSSSQTNVLLETEDSDIEVVETANEEPQVTSILQKLKAPTQSDISTKRKIQHRPPTGKKKSSGQHSLKEPTVVPS